MSPVPLGSPSVSHMHWNPNNLHHYILSQFMEVNYWAFVKLFRSFFETLAQLCLYNKNIPYTPQPSEPILRQRSHEMHQTSSQLLWSFAFLLPLLVSISLQSFLYYLIHFFNNCYSTYILSHQPFSSYSLKWTCLGSQGEGEERGFLLSALCQGC